MKKSTLFLMIATFAISLTSSCSKNDDDNDNNNNNNNTLPDANFEMNVSGAESYSFSFTLPANVASTHAINGSHLASQEVLSIAASELPITWLYGLIADISTLSEGTFDLKVGASAFSNPTQTNAYTAVSGTITISKATLFQTVSSVEDWFIDGTYSGTYQDAGTPPNQITISGSFSGVNIKAQ